MHNLQFKEFFQLFLFAVRRKLVELFSDGYFPLDDWREDEHGSFHLINWKEDLSSVSETMGRVGNVPPLLKRMDKCLCVVEQTNRR